MPYYMRMGNIPHKRHTIFRRPDGKLYTEELFGVEGFSGIASLLYHYNPPVRATRIQPCPEITAALTPKIAPQEVQRHHHLKTAQMPAGGDPIQARRILMFNNDIRMALARPTEQMPYYYRNSQADEMYFIHQGRGVFETIFGNLPYEPGDYIVLPHGTTYRVVLDVANSPDGQRWFVSEAKGRIEVPKRYRNEYGQMLEHSPYCERDISGPTELAPVIEDPQPEREYEVIVRAADMVTAYHYESHPFDVVGWDGYLYPWRFNIRDFEPITGRIHQPPPVHQTFQGPNFVVCSFVPRKFDYHPEGIPAPYNHSNIDSEEMIYYVNGNFMSRKGVEVGSITMHPHGIPHGPAPGAAEASIGKEATEELAVMIDTFHPIYYTEAAMEIDDPSYPFSWYEQDK